MYQAAWKNFRTQYYYKKIKTKESNNQISFFLQKKSTLKIEIKHLLNYFLKFVKVVSAYLWRNPISIIFYIFSAFTCILLIYSAVLFWFFTHYYFILFPLQSIYFPVNIHIPSYLSFSSKYPLYSPLFQNLHLILRVSIKWDSKKSHLKKNLFIKIIYFPLPLKCFLQNILINASNV